MACRVPFGFGLVSFVRLDRVSNRRGGASRSGGDEYQARYFIQPSTDEVISVWPGGFRLVRVVVAVVVVVVVVVVVFCFLLSA